MHQIDPWKEFVINVSAILTPVIAIATGTIAYQQWRTNKDKLRLDLYEKRYSVYDGIRSALKEIMIEGVISDNGISKFIISTNDVKFLFDQDVPDYIKIFRDKMFRLKSVTRQLSDRNLPQGDQRTELAQENYDLTGWFHDQFDPLSSLFEKYLRFKK